MSSGPVMHTSMSKPSTGPSMSARPGLNRLILRQAPLRFGSVISRTIAASNGSTGRGWTSTPETMPSPRSVKHRKRNGRLRKRATPQ